MTDHIIETLGPWGVKTTPYRFRWQTPKAGDVIRFDEDVRRYPVSYKFCRIDHVDEDEQCVGIVDSMGSAFISENGHLSISGGPFFGLPLKALTPTGDLQETVVWNWGDNSPGAAQGVHYRILRPVFRALAHPDEYPTRYARDEQDARKGGLGNHEPLWHAELIHVGPKLDGYCTYHFQVERTVMTK